MFRETVDNKTKKKAPRKKGEKEKKEGITCHFSRREEMRRPSGKVVGSPPSSSFYQNKELKHEYGRQLPNYIGCGH